MCVVAAENWWDVIQEWEMGNKELYIQKPSYGGAS
jgi:hypothetical protein